MEEVVGYKFNKFNLNLKVIVDLIYFDGSLLSLFENEYGDSYLYYWCDVDDFHNRWLVFRVSKVILKRYITGKTTLRELILKPVEGFLYSLDIDNNLEIKNTYLIQPENLPDIYIPGEKSYYDFSNLNNATMEQDKFLIQLKLYN